MKIAISGLAGCGNSTACKNVASALGLEFVNYTFRDLAKEKGKTLEWILEERKKNAGLDYELDWKLLQAAEKKKNVVVGSRLACWLVPADLRVWLDAPLEVRAKRIAEREGKKLADVLKATGKRDEGDARQYRELYGIDLNDFAEVADLVVDAGALDAEGVAGKIVSAAKNARKIKKKSGMHYPEKLKELILEKIG